jgi:RimJ/RimL family protein N-acetyltransferase
MLSLVFEQNPVFSRYAAQKIGVNGFGPHSTIGVFDGDRIVAVIVYSRYDGHQCEISIATESPTWASRRILAALFSYPFNQLKVKRAGLIIRADNAKSISLATRLGFKRETNEQGLRQYCRDGESAHVFGMLKSECKWING